MMTHH